ncbi:MAG: molybdate ABC transporter substrate-binding protein [Gaiellaceae bacterium]
MRRVGLAALAVALVLAPAGGAADQARLTVFAASSLTDVLPAIDGRPGYSFAGSNQLAFQIRQGAPADVFASAAPSYAQELYRAGLVERPRTFASNALVLAAPRSNPAGIRTVWDLRDKKVQLVVGTASVPIGDYTRRVLRRLGLASVLDKAVSQEPDVKSIVGKLAVGEADAGFVYRTDVRAAGGRLRAVSIPAWAQPAISYQVAVVRASRSRAAARGYVASLSTPRAKRLLRNAGFTVR